MTSKKSDLSTDLVALLPRLRRFARVLAGNASDADDLVQDAVERALTKRHQWQSGTRLDSWVFRIMQTTWIDTLRSRKVRTASSLDSEGMDAPGVDGRQAMEAHLGLARTRAALASMAADQRMVVGLVLIEGYSYREAADILGVPEGTVTSRLFRARTILDSIVNTPIDETRAGAKGGAP